MGVWQEIADYTVPSNTTSVVLDSFGTITKDDFVKVEITHTNPLGSQFGLRLLANASTNTNYHRQVLGANSSSVVAIRINHSVIFDTPANKSKFGFGFIKLSENDKFNYFGNDNFETTSGVQNAFQYTTSSGTTFPSGITSLTFEAEATNGIGTGSRIQIYKLAATKVADITVASNTTQVDISNLSIDKDSEYLLVSDFVGAAGFNMDLVVNDNTTASNYYTQFIRGFGSSTQATRYNTPHISSTGSGTNSLIYSHIKLSNIGAYTYQSYNMIAGGTIIQVGNWFGSSTAENITSITKISIVVSVANAIAAGARFQLYKLY